MTAYRTLLAAAAAAALVIPAAAGQRAQAQDSPASGLPEACRTAAAAHAGGHGHGQAMQGHNMHGGMSQQMQGAMAGMSEAHKGFMDAMTRMNEPMMTGMMAGDADVAWACSMIPHHQGAIDMSRALLRSGGDNAEARRMAEKVISDQEREIAELTRWVEENAKAEGNE
jgi:uncharacterized protein (DUF305 family)